MFASLNPRRSEAIQGKALLKVIEESGISPEDPRLHASMAALRREGIESALSYGSFLQIVQPDLLLLESIFQGTLVIPDFRSFCETLRDIYERTHELTSGQVADYIPQLARVSPSMHGISLCTVDGQSIALGDATVPFSVQSCCKPILYSLALEEHGEALVHSHVGREPSGHSFNELTLNPRGLPHNPLINAGAIMCASLLRPEQSMADRFDYVIQQWQKLTGSKVSFNNAVYLSELETADRNFALGYFMREKKAFPEGINLIETLQFYFQCCSVEMNATQMAVVAATLANSGVNPITGKRVLRSDTVRNCLSMMFSCGMYDFSGEFAFTIGLPAKSGVSGAVMVVVPGVAGFCIWSPPLDETGNSVRGVAFCKELVKQFNFHVYDHISSTPEKQDPTIDPIQQRAESVERMMWAAAKGDLGAIKRLLVQSEATMFADYDRRTPLHLAAAEGQQSVLSYLLKRGFDPNPKDRWGGTPLDDAQMSGHDSVALFLREQGAVHGRSHPAKSLEEGTEKAPISESELTVPLIWAASLGACQTLSKLYVRGADLNGADYDHRTPLHLAAAEGQLEAIQLLLGLGAHPRPIDRWGHTPLEEAKRHGHKEAADIIHTHLTKEPL